MRWCSGVEQAAPAWSTAPRRILCRGSTAWHSVRPLGPANTCRREQPFRQARRSQVTTGRRRPRPAARPGPSGSGRGATAPARRRPSPAGRRRAEQLGQRRREPGPVDARGPDPTGASDQLGRGVPGHGDTTRARRQRRQPPRAGSRRVAHVQHRIHPGQQLPGHPRRRVHRAPLRAGQRRTMASQPPAHEPRGLRRRRRRAGRAVAQQRLHRLEQHRVDPVAHDADQPALVALSDHSTGSGQCGEASGTTVTSASGRRGGATRGGASPTGPAARRRALPASTPATRAPPAAPARPGCRSRCCCAARPRPRRPPTPPRARSGTRSGRGPPRRPRAWSRPASPPCGAPTRRTGRAGPAGARHQLVPLRAGDPRHGVEHLDRRRLGPLEVGPLLGADQRRQHGDGRARRTRRRARRADCGAPRSWRAGALGRPSQGSCGARFARRPTKPPSAAEARRRGARIVLATPAYSARTARRGRAARPAGPAPRAARPRRSRRRGAPGGPARRRARSTGNAAVAAVVRSSVSQRSASWSSVRARPSVNGADGGAPQPGQVPADPSAAPRSRARARTYVPDEHCTRTSRSVWSPAGRARARRSGARDASGGQLDLLAAAHPGVRPLPGHLDRRHRRRHLVERPDEAGHRLRTTASSRSPAGARPEHRRPRRHRCSCYAPSRMVASYALSVPGQVAQQPGGAPDRRRRAPRSPSGRGCPRGRPVGSRPAAAPGPPRRAR